MTSITKKLYNGTLTATNGTVYTVPSTSGGYVVVKTITACNISAIDGWVTVKLDGSHLAYQQLVPAKKSIIITGTDHVLDPLDLIEALANATLTIDLIISGKEVSP